MSIDSVDLDEESVDLFFTLAHNLAARFEGREVVVGDAFALKEEVQRSLLDYIFLQDLEDPSFDGMALKLAWMGSEDRSLLEREIVELFSTPEGLFLRTREGTVVPAGFKKSVSRFWKKHKKEILIGAVVVAVIIAIVVIKTCTGGAEAAAAGAGGTAVFKAVQEMLDEKEKSSPSAERFSDPVPPFEETSSPDLCFTEEGIVVKGNFVPYVDLADTDCQNAVFSSLLAPDPLPLGPLTLGEMAKLESSQQSPGARESLPSWQAGIPSYQKEGVVCDGISYTYDQWMRYTEMRAKEEAFWRPVQGAEGGGLDGSAAPPLLPSVSLEHPNHRPQEEIPFPGPSPQTAPSGSFASPPSPPKGTETTAPSFQSPRIFVVPGKQTKSCLVIGTNGINTPFADAQGHSEYLSRLAGDESVTWVYNKTNGLPIDLAEALLLNAHGISVNKEDYQEVWRKFHEENRDNPHAKCLQICHSQGAAQVRNALVYSPQEIQDRVIVVAIAPEAVIPAECCYKSFNYSSKRDIVPYTGILRASFFDSEEVGMSTASKVAWEHHEQIIWLEPHPDAELLDHSFQSPTFQETIYDHLQDYFKRGGIYE